MQNFSEYANTLRRKMKFSKEETIFVCIGSNKVIWDSIGPYVGSILKEKIGDKIAITKLKKQASLSEIQNVFLKSIDNYLEKIENFKF